MIQHIKSRLQASIDLKTALLSNDTILNTVQLIVNDIVTSFVPQYFAISFPALDKFSTLLQLDKVKITKILKSIFFIYII